MVLLCSSKNEIVALRIYNLVSSLERLMIINALEYTILFQRSFALKLRRGECVFRYSKCGNLIVVAWKDNKVVVVLSTDPSFQREIHTVERRDRSFVSAPNRTKEVAQPIIVNRYIKWMRGVDLA